MPKPICSPVGTTVCGSGCRPGLNHVLVKQVLELRSPYLVSRRVGVGQIVGDVVHIDLLRGHAAGGADIVLESSVPCCLSLCGNARYFVRSTVHFGMDLYRFGQTFKLAQYLNQPDRSFGWRKVGTL